MRKINKKSNFDFSDLCTIYSYKGWLKYCDSYRLLGRYTGGFDERIKKCNGK